MNTVLKCNSNITILLLTCNIYACDTKYTNIIEQKVKQAKRLLTKYLPLWAPFESITFLESSNVLYMEFFFSAV